MKPIKNNIIVELHVPDFEVAKNFYLKLGFEITEEDSPRIDKPGYMTMNRKDPLGGTFLNFYGGNNLVYKQAFFKQFPKDTPRGYEIEVTVPVKDIDGLYNKVQKTLPKNIVREISQLEDCGEKWKDFRMVDPFGFYLRFTELIDWSQP